ncbi:hypothetical protein [uncultured Nocardioides sp.]|uniref:hypothetical protein n=1 Tax=uncultured Nocardioides sp. TaxID=198441 RepID=UPI00262CEC7A|nr:hypothetical protein [uncultured Nocardioides sp.]
MTTEGGDREVFLVPLGDETVLAVPVEAQDRAPDADGPDLAALIHAVGPLVGAALKGRNATGATCFEMSPESLQQFKDARLDNVGSYFRGVLRNPDGQISHQVQLREVQAAPAPPGFDPVAVTQMVQMASIQAQLDRIEDTLADLTISVEQVARFLETQQRARIEAAIQLLRELHDRARVTGAVSETDWNRLSGVELDLETQLRAVRAELTQRLSGRSFGSSPSADAKQMKEIDPKRIAELVELHRLLLGGLRGWNELLLLRKFETGELSDGEVAVAIERLSNLEDHHRTMLAQIKKVASASKMSKPRGALQRLLTDGILLGGQNDARNLSSVKDGRRILKVVLKSAAPELSKAPERKMLEAAPDDEVA